MSRGRKSGQGPRVREAHEALVDVSSQSHRALDFVCLNKKLHLWYWQREDHFHGKRHAQHAFHSCEHNRKSQRVRSPHCVHFASQRSWKQHRVPLHGWEGRSTVTGHLD